MKHGTHRKPFSLLLALALLLTLLPAVSIPARADEVYISDTNGDCTWTLENTGGSGMTLTVRPTDGVGPAAMRADLGYRIGVYLYRITTVIIKDGVTNIPDYFLYDTQDPEGKSWLDSLNTIVLPDSVTSIGQYAFASTHGHTYRLTSPLNTSHLEEIGYKAFMGMVIDRELTFPVIRSGSFVGVTADKLVFPNLTSIEGEMFTACHSDVDLSGSTITTIPGAAFEQYDGSALYLPSTLKTVEARAFRFATGPSDVYFAGTPSQWAQVDIDDSVSSVDGKNGNEALRNATVHFAMDGSVTIPSEGVKGQVLTATVHLTSASASSLHYQWQRKTNNWYDIAGAINQTYTVKVSTPTARSAVW